MCGSKWQELNTVHAVEIIQGWESLVKKSASDNIDTPVSVYNPLVRGGKCNLFYPSKKLSEVSCQLN